MNKGLDELLAMFRELLNTTASDDREILDCGDRVADNDPLECDHSALKITSENPAAASNDDGETGVDNLADKAPGMDKATPADPQNDPVDSFTGNEKTTPSDAVKESIWSNYDDWILRLAWGLVQINFIATILKRSPDDIRSRAIQLRARRSGRWTQTESQLLKKLYGSRKQEDLEVTLMRSSAQIEAAARQMNLRKDRPSVERRETDADLDGNNQRTRSKSTSSKARTQRGSMPRWSQVEIKKLQDLYSNHGNQQIATILGRSITSIANKAWQLGLTKSSEQLTKIGRSNVARRHKRK